jgi:hypothetical protein
MRSAPKALIGLALALAAAACLTAVATHDTNAYFSDTKSGTFSGTLSPSYNVSATSGANGSVSPPSQTVSWGGNATVTVAPALGYHIATLLVDSVSIPATDTVVFTDVKANHTVSATFAINAYTIAPKAGPNGSISPSTTQTVTYGGKATFKITPSCGYHIATLLVDSVSVPATGTVVFTNVKANHTVAATFAATCPRTWTITASAGSGGSISPSSQTVDSGGDAIFKITPKCGYRIADVKVDGKSVGAVSSYTFTKVTANHTISATFAINTCSIVPKAGPNGTISPSTTQTVSYGGSATFKITPDARYRVADVKVDGKSVGAVSSYKFTNVTVNHAISATFTKSNSQGGD